MKKHPTKEFLSEPARLALVQNTPMIEAALEQLLASVDDSSHECESCALVIRHFYRDHQLAENLRSMLHKIRNWHREARTQEPEGGGAGSVGVTSFTPG